MRNTLVLTGKELMQIFFGPIAYVFLIVFALIPTILFFRSFFLIGQVTLSGFFFWIPWAFVFVVPGITMRTWAEERKQGTVELLLTSPVTTGNLVAAKFLSALALVAGCLLLTIWIPITVSGYGDLDWGPVIGGYLGALLMGGACIAIGMFWSSFTQEQIVSFLVTLIMLLVLVFIGNDYILSLFGKGSWVGNVARYVSPTTHFESIGRGVIDLRDLYYFGGVMVLFLYLNTRVIDLRRWR